MMFRSTEPFLVANVEPYGEVLILTSAGGCIFHRNAADFIRPPTVGEELVLESIGCRITGLYAPTDDTWLFRWNDEELAAQNAAITTE